jgi:hypothetical protein
MENKDFIYIICKDMEIYGIFNNFTICVLEFLHKIINDIDILINIKNIYGTINNEFIDNIKEYKIIKMLNNSSISINNYILCFTDFILKDSQGDIVDDNNYYLQKIHYIKEKFFLLYDKKIEKLTNINKHKLPYKDTNDNQKELTDLEERINKLTDIQNLQNKISENNENNENKENKTIDKCNSRLKKDNIQINQLKRKKAMLDEKKNVYLADLKIYNLIKDKIANNEMEIPLLFVNKFELFAKMENDNTTSFEEYYKNIPNKIKIPISSNFSSLFEHDESANYANISDTKYANYANISDTEYASSSDDESSVDICVNQELN